MIKFSTKVNLPVHALIPVIEVAVVVVDVVILQHFLSVFLKE